MQTLTNEEANLEGFKKMHTVPEEPVLHVTRRAELRSALRELNPASLGNKFAEAHLEGNPDCSLKPGEVQQKWPACGPTRPKSPRFSSRLPRAILREEPQTADFSSRSKQPTAVAVDGQRGHQHDEDVFVRLSRACKTTHDKNNDNKSVEQSYEEMKRNLIARYKGRTIPREFHLSVTNSARFAANKLGRTGSEPRIRYNKGSKSDALQRVPNGRTEPEPFNLASLKLHEEAVARHQAQLAQEETRVTAQRCYRALPLRQDMLDGPTFIPVLLPPEHSVTIPDEQYCTHSDERAIRRAEFDEHTQKRLQDEAAAREAAAAAREHAEEERLRVEWNTHMFRARAMPDFDAIRQRNSMAERPCGLRPTSPHTPANLTKTRNCQFSQVPAKPPHGALLPSQPILEETSVITGFSNLTFEDA